MKRLHHAIATSFLANLGSLILLVRVDSANVLIKLSGLCIVGASLGFILGAVFGRGCVTSIGWSAFAALALACMPVVLVTYGFALMGTPLVAGYAVIVAAGARCGAQTMEHFGEREGPGSGTPPTS
jgi:hypothetical protein